MRLPGLDAARALAMLVVIALHAAIPYMTTPIGWAVQEDSRHVAADLFVWCARAVAMPLFFWLSGFGARAVLERGGRAGFVRHRITRVLLPFLVALVPCSLVLAELWAIGEVAPRPEVAAQIPKLERSSLPVTLGHLWYLYYLLAVSALAAVASELRVTVPARWIVPLVTVVLAAILGLARTLHLDTPQSFALDPATVCFYGTCFAWGFVVHAHPEELARYADRAWWLVAAAPLVLLACVPALRDAAAGDPGAPAIYASVASALFTITSVAAILGLGHRYARPHRTIRFAADASYWCYVVHLPVLVAWQLAQKNFAVWAPMELVAGFVVTSAFALATYAVVRSLRRRWGLDQGAKTPGNPRRRQ